MPNITNAVLQAKVFEEFSTTDLVLSGDGRCDSPGKTAKYCTYTMMDVDSNKILHFENIDKREVQLRSPNMEREGMIRCLKFLIDNGMQVKELVTDSSTSVAKTLGKNFCLHYNIIIFSVATQYPNVHHSRDVWHKAKKLKKVLYEVNT